MAAGNTHDTDNMHSLLAAALGVGKAAVPAGDAQMACTHVCRACPALLQAAALSASSSGLKHAEKAQPSPASLSAPCSCFPQKNLNLKMSPLWAGAFFNLFYEPVFLFYCYRGNPALNEKQSRLLPVNVYFSFYLDDKERNGRAESQTQRHDVW